MIANARPHPTSSLRAVGSLAILMAGLSLPAPAPAETAREILDEVRSRNEAREPKDLATTMKMSHFRSGEVRFMREIRSYSRRYDDGTSKSLVIFLSPFDVRGVRFLAWEDPSKPDRQWLYLPGQARVRRLAPTLQDQSFQGTAFTYADLELFEEMRDWTEADAASRLLEEGEAVDGAPCVVIELTPKRSNVAYGRILLWIHVPDATLRQAELHDRDGTLSKRVRFAEFQDVDDVPIAHRLEIEDVRGGGRTLLETLEAEVNPGLEEALFEPAGLEQTS